MKLVIVESPTKANTIGKFLGKDYKVESSYGHVRDLPKSKIGIDIENNFEPSYLIPVKSKKRIGELKKLVPKAEEIILATDEDREGEAISWHLVQALSLDKLKSKPKNQKKTSKKSQAKNASEGAVSSEETQEEKKIPVKRIVFHEITKTAIEEALGHPREIDINLVNAQQARRVLDRLVGYKLSPFLWKKIFRGLSAGRVQSVALRLIVDREKEIADFKADEYWSLTASLKKEKDEDKFEASLFSHQEKNIEKLEIKNKERADKILEDLKNAEYRISKIIKKEVRRSPLPPFTTSTLQQEGANKLRYSAKQTMMVAQSLYENGLITYMRTDSVNLSRESIEGANKTIADSFGQDYVLEEPRIFKNKSKGAQEAHEAIRPTDPSKLPENLELEPRAQKLYSLIWKRFIACQMKEAIFDATSVIIEAKDYGFKATGNILKYDGFLKVYPAKINEKNLPPLEEKEKLELVELLPEQHFTEPPARYNEASLVKTMEEFGIGRPSTYAPTISTIRARNYVEKNSDRRFVPTEVGTMVSNLLVEHFPQIVDVGFTAKIEEDFDDISLGKKEWSKTIGEFYGPFSALLEKKYESVEKTNTEEETDEVCEKCGKPMILKRGRFGKFLACTGFPECKNTKSVKEPPKTIGMQCPDCKEGEVVIKFSRNKRMFFGCSRYPDCKYASWKNPKGENAEENT